MSNVTRILGEIDAGDPRAADQLLPLVYNELRKLAAQRLAQEKPGQTLQATALVHEAYLRLVGARSNGARSDGARSASKGAENSHASASGAQFTSRGHFFAAAAEAMRRILIDQARHKAAEKAGGNFRRVDLTEIEPAISGPQLDLLALNDALEQLEKSDPRGAAVVKLRFFAGLTMPQVAEALGVSLATAENDWAYAKCCLRLQLSEAENNSSG